MKPGNIIRKCIAADHLIFILGDSRTSHTLVNILTLNVFYFWNISDHSLFRFDIDIDRKDFRSKYNHNLLITPPSVFTAKCYLE